MIYPNKKNYLEHPVLHIHHYYLGEKQILETYLTTVLNAENMPNIIENSSHHQEVKFSADHLFTY